MNNQTVRSFDGAILVSALGVNTKWAIRGHVSVDVGATRAVGCAHAPVSVNTMARHAALILHGYQGLMLYNRTTFTLRRILGAGVDIIRRQVTG